ncbi:uncharacterized protein LOC111284284 isoform X2 [Durio zibethinus]|uniref:Uncharacterized protein LOC111284284 isoform X2 n=1 Tax=Durio zibethinus TaxID=66656 RepID=A0A6P5XKM8_DURZI|nr:uncharacterized protein LOC111284284 isoform X2 [Durio zibethinus]
MRWEKVQLYQQEVGGVGGACPGPGKRWGHTCNSIKGGGLLYVFGGYGKDNCQTNQVHVFDTAKQTWSQPVMKGTPPTPRDSHSCTTVGDNLFVFGGTDGMNPLKDLHILETATHTWICPSVRGEGPEPREGHSAALVGKRLFIFGGCGKSSDNNDEIYYNDLYILNTETFVWKHAATSGNPPSARDSHTCSSWKNKIIVIGGEDGHDYYLSDVHILDADMGMWTRVITIGDGPSARFSVAGDCLDPLKSGVLVFIGGCNKTLEALGDMYYLYTGLVRDERKLEKLSLRKQLKLKCQEKNLSNLLHDKALVGIEVSNDMQQPVPLSSYAQPRRENFPLNQILLQGKKTFQAKVTESFPNGYSIETVIEGKPLRGILFANKPSSVHVANYNPSRKRTSVEVRDTASNGDCNSKSRSSRSMSQDCGDHKQADVREKDSSLHETEAPAPSSRNLAPSGLSTDKDPVKQEPSVAPLNLNNDKTCDAPNSGRETLKGIGSTRAGYSVSLSPKQDDITQIDDDQGMNHSLKGLNSQCDISDNMLHVEGQLHPLQISTESNAYKDILFEKVSAAGSSRLGEKGPECITNADQTTFGASVSQANLVKLAVPTEQALGTSLENSNASDQLAKGGSPFRLLQGYASDDNSAKDVETGIENTNVSFGAKLGGDAGSSLENPSSSSQIGKGFGPLSLSSMPCAVVSSEVVEDTITTSIINGNEHAGNKHVHQVYANHAASGEVLHKENVIVGASVDSVKFSKEHRQEEENVTLGSQHKVDKFGRLVRNGASDSDSDDLHYTGRRRRGRTRSRSRSHSPPDRRKRRSPWRRREKRSLSRSWSPRNRRSRSRSPKNRRSRSRSPRNWRSRSRSPRNRRSRSRSPNFRRADEFSGENKRRVKGQMPFCFDFRRGRCYRGVSCRYLHHDSGNSDESRRQRSKQYLEFPHSSRTNVHDQKKRISEKVDDHEHGEVRGPEVKPYGDFVTSRDRNTNQKRDYSIGGGVHNQDGQSTEYCMVKSVKSRDIPTSASEAHLVENKQEGPNLVSNENCQEAAAESHHPSNVDASSVGDIDVLKSCGNASQKILTSFKKSVDQKSLSSPLNPVCQNADCLPQQSDNSSLSDSSLHKASTSSPNSLRASNAHPNTAELHNHPSHIASPSLPHSHGIDNPYMKQQQTASSMFQSSSESFPSYMLPNQQSYFSLQPHSSVTSLPPPPPLPSLDSTVTPGVSSHFWHSDLPLRNDFGSQIMPRPYPTELPAHSKSDGFHQRAYLPIQEANRPFLHVSLPVCNLPMQQFGAPSMSGDDGLAQPPVQNVIASNSFAQGNTHPHTMPFSQQLLGNKMIPFPSESLPPGGLSNSSSYIHPYSQQQQPPDSSHCPVVDRIYNLHGKMNSSLKDPPTSQHVDIGGSTSSTFPNPYASILDQPINSKYSSDIMHEKDTTYNKTPLILTHPPVDGRVIGSQQATSSSISARDIGLNFPRSGGDQYDPLFDSIEPSTRLSRNFDYIQKLEVTGDSDILLVLSGSNKPLDVEENNKRKDAGAVASAASADNEEFGETADAEVGAVENGSPSNPVEVNMAAGEIEIDQKKSPGKSKKSKDSRSMKLFRVALADFVKEVLKPSWQQGNMSKEAFKTIVKKTVDKVSGAMKSHQIPKSRAKIDQYIESSRLKLTKLVMGYVDKYVKV